MDRRNLDKLIPERNKPFVGEQREVTVSQSRWGAAAWSGVSKWRNEPARDRDFAGTRRNQLSLDKMQSVETNQNVEEVHSKTKPKQNQIVAILLFFFFFWKQSKMEREPILLHIYEASAFWQPRQSWIQKITNERMKKTELLPPRSNTIELKMAAQEAGLGENSL